MLSIVARRILPSFAGEFCHILQHDLSIILSTYTRVVPQRDVRDGMRENSRRFYVVDGKHPLRHKDRPAGQRDRLELRSYVGVHEEAILKSAVGPGGELVPDRLEARVGPRLPRRLRISLQLFPELDFLFDRVEIDALRRGLR
jgi:hypothetical protein